MLLGIFIFVVLIVIHEIGHFIAAKRNNVEVEEFGLGFPPRLFGLKLGKGKWRTFYTLNLLPLGGFVRLKGENETDRRKGSYGAARFKSKVKIILAGVAMNAVLAIGIFTVQAGVGMPQLFDNQFRLETYVTSENMRIAVATVDEMTPAEEVGLREGDILVSIDGQPITTEASLLSNLAKNASTSVEIEYQHDGKTMTETTTLMDGSDEQGYLGFIPLELNEVRHSWLAAPVVGVGTAVEFSVLTVEGFAHAFWNLITGNFGSAAENITGPVGIFAILSSLENVGFDYLIFFGGILSMTLAIMNTLPLPALDGGRLAVSFLVRTKRFELIERREELIHVVGFMAMLLLAIVITLVDVGRF